MHNFIFTYFGISGSILHELCRKRHEIIYVKGADSMTDGAFTAFTRGLIVFVMPMYKETKPGMYV